LAIVRTAGASSQTNGANFPSIGHALYSQRVFWLPKRIAQLSLAWVVVGCSEPAGPSLLKVTDLSPRSVEPGDVIELKGSGFPEGKAATVTLEGTLYRAGLPNVADYRVTFEARGESNRQVSFTLGDEIDEALAEGDGHTAHGTFRGRALVSFAPRIAGAPPISGELADLSLELFSSGGSSERASEVDDARRLTELLGVTLEPSERTLKIGNVVPGRAQRAGLVAGDVILSANGVSVFETTDLLPARQEREVQLVVKRSDTIRPWPVRLSIDGFSPLLPAAFSWVLAVVVMMVAWLVLLFSTVRSNGLLSIWSIANPRPKAHTGGAWWLAGLIGLGCAVLDTAPLGGAIARLQYTVALLGILLLRPLVGFLAHRGQTRGFPLRRATGDAFKIQVLELCVLLSLWPVLLHTGGLGPLELRAAQGAWPLQWLAFRSVPTALTAVLFLMSCLYDASGREEEPLLAVRSGVAGRGLLRWDSALVFLKCALFVTLFLGGGWHSSPALRWLSLLIFGVKYVLLTAIVLHVRSRLGHPSRSTVSQSFYFVFLLSVLAGGLLLLAGRWGGIPLVEWLRQSVPLALTLTALAGLLLLGRSRSVAPVRGTVINPWL
jgi:hypothetical protein